MCDRDDRDLEFRELLAAQRNGLVECPHCHHMVEEEALGWVCESCRSEGCDLCIGYDKNGSMVCLDPFDSNCFGGEE